MAKGRTWLACVVVLVGLVGLGGGVGFLAWRRNGPRRVLRASFGARDSMRAGIVIARFLDGGRLRFVGSGRLIVAEQFCESTIDYRGDIWSLETGALERTLRVFPTCIDERCARALDLDPLARAVDAIDLTTGARTRIWKGLACCYPISLAGDTIAVLASDTALELRSVTDGEVRRTIHVPDSTRIPTGSGERVLLAPRADRASVERPGRSVVVGDLARDAWMDLGECSPIAFTPSGLVVRPIVGGRSGALTLVRPDGSRQELDREPGSEVSPFAISASGELLAVARKTAGGDASEVVVESIETGEVVKRVALKRGRAVCELALSPDGDRLAIASREHETEEAAAGGASMSWRRDDGAADVGVWSVP